MKILYDQQIFSFQDHGGISRYFYELASRIKKTNNKVLVDGKFSNNIYLPKLKNRIVKVFPKLDFPHRNVFIFYLNRLFDSHFLNEGKFDIFHATYFHPYFLNKLNGKPYVVTVYDMISELFTKDFKGIGGKTLKYKKETIVNANHIIAISENTKKDLINLYGISKNKVSVIYLGNPLENVIPSKVENLPNKYLLFVGNRQGYKNFTFFVKSVDPILRENKELSLLCAGGGEFSSEENNVLSKLKIIGQVKQVGFKNDSELAFIYKNAFIYILPSLYEGFGMTVLEAFSMGCPVLAGNSSSIPEVCGKAAMYIDSSNTDSIRGGIQKMVDNEKLRRKLIKSGFEQIKKFNWEKIVKETLCVYKKMAKPNN